MSVAIYFEIAIFLDLCIIFGFAIEPVSTTKAMVAIKVAGKMVDSLRLLSKTTSPTATIYHL